ncbi:MAG: zinc ribbon domain-containing protein [Rhodoferax sp.]|nr:zinc ribbon domain-containing protein [Rhodoferax sp.]MCW5587889.1 zinc ribbon domain-containing protein [Chromatiales bacterium]
MPIYAYKCDSCGFAKDVLQKISDAPLSECPSCHAGAFRKQVTAAGFQLKGSGWYVTDFRGGNNAAAPKSGEASSDTAGGSTGASAESKSSGTAPAKAESKPESKPAAAPTTAKATTTTSSGSGSGS